MAILETESPPGLLALKNQTKVQLETLSSFHLQERILSTMQAYWECDATEIPALSSSDLTHLVVQDQLVLVVLLLISLQDDNVLRVSCYHRSMQGELRLSATLGISWDLTSQAPGNEESD